MALAKKSTPYQQIRKSLVFEVTYDQWDKDTQLHAIGRCAKVCRNHPLTRLALTPYVKRDGTEDAFTLWAMAVCVYLLGIDAVAHILSKLKYLMLNGEKWYKKFWDEIDILLRLRGIDWRDPARHEELKERYQNTAVPVRAEDTAECALSATDAQSPGDLGSNQDVVYPRPRGPD